MYEDIDRPEFLRRGLDHPIDVGTLCQVTEHADRTDAMLGGHGFRDGGQRRSFAIFRGTVLAHAMDGDIGAQARKPLCKSPAEAAPGAGDQCDLAG